MTSENLSLRALDKECALYVLMSALEREIKRLQEEKSIYLKRMKEIETKFNFNPSDIEETFKRGIYEELRPELKFWFDEKSLQESVTRDLREAENLYSQIIEIFKNDNDDIEK